MVNLASYFVKNQKNLVADVKHIVKGKNYRFTILTPRLIRIEYSPSGIFEDRATSLVVNRNFQGAKFNVNFDDLSLTITTEYFH